MEPLNLMVSLSHFGNAKSTLPPKQKRRTTSKPRGTTTRRATRRAIRWFRTATAR
ncbi:MULTISPECIES: hypothetical protein [unclassified Kribbella]|uniref:hypothetical protein n=1 Tax=unclassified Kribbella TaxID=2644121 RepID=UPI003409A20F